MNYVAPLDLAWLLVESPDTPMDVGVLQIFSPPDGCQPADFCRQTFSAWSQAQCGGHPFNLRARRQGLKSPEWVPVEQLDLERHLQAWSLTRAGSDDELGELVGRLFAAELDMTLPPWETHLIEGLQKIALGS